MFFSRRERASDDQHALLAGRVFAPPRSRRNQPIALLMMSTDLASLLILDRWSYQSRLNSKPARSTLMTTEPGSSHRSGTASVQTVDGRLWSPPAGGQLPTHIHGHGAIAVEVAPHRWLGRARPTDSLPGESATDQTARRLLATTAAAGRPELSDTDPSGCSWPRDARADLSEQNGNTYQSGCCTTLRCVRPRFGHDAKGPRQPASGGPA